MINFSFENYRTYMPFGAIVFPLIPPLVKNILNFELFNFKLRRKNELEDFKFLSEFYDVEIANRQPILIEKAFSYYFKKNLNYDEIIAILKLNNPSRLFRLLISSEGYIEVDKKGIFKFRSGVSKLWMRIAWIIFFLTFYAFGIVLCFSPIIYNDTNLSDLTIGSSSFLIIWMLACVPIWYSSIKAFIYLLNACSFMSIFNRLKK